MRAPVVSRKHYVQTSLTTVAAGTASAINLLVAVQPNVVNLTTEVAEGAVVKAVYLEYWVLGTAESVGNVLVTFIKVPDGQTPTFSDMVGLYDYNNKKNVFYHTQGLTNFSSADAIPLIRQWFKIPKGKQRMGAGDQLYVVVSAQAGSTNVCGFATYKSYS